MGPAIIVVGSINLDMVIQTPRAPEAGETIVGRTLSYVPGGKGANQAVAAARLGGQVTMIGRVGDDPFSRPMCENLTSNGVAASHVRATAETSTGVAVILLEDNGENRIVLAQGANGALRPEDVDAAADVFQGAACILLQNEVPLETTVRAARLGREAGALVVWSPAPAPESLPPELPSLVDLVLPNETEAAMLSGVAGSPGSMAEGLLQKGFRTALITLGSRGSLWAGEDEHFETPAIEVEVVDTTAAGDTFAGAVAVALAEGMPPREAVRFASVAAGLSVTRLGAQNGMPSREQVESRLASEPGC
jgi:ribokinase